ncbi:hypothetical protein BU15DRAFT_69332 [Melanogaster broomeanus]|nr:hypothetical protein BU15DRAFT_69332 [Melanogaster broomeanus]
MGSEVKQEIQTESNNWAENDQGNESTSSKPLARLRRLVTLTTNVFRRLQSHPEDLELSQWGHRPVWARVAQGKVKSFWATAQTTPPRPQNVVEFSDDEGDSQSLHQTPKGTHAAIGPIGNGKIVQEVPVELAQEVWILYSLHLWY